MRDSIKRLRDAYTEYIFSRQARYDELLDTAYFDYPENLTTHKLIVERLNIEESSPEFVNEVLISVSTYVMDDAVYKMNFDGTPAEKLFDLR